MPSLRTLAGSALAPVLVACGAVYLPSDEARQAREVADDDELRQSLRIFNDVAAGCSDEGATGTLRNRSTSQAKAVVEVRFVALDGSSTVAEVAVSVGPDDTVPWEVAAPEGASSAGGCQPAIRDATRA